MPDIKKVSAGAPLGSLPSMSAGWLNSVSDMLAWYHRMKATGDSGGSGEGLADSSGIVSVKNSTGGDLVRGHVVQLGDYLLTDVSHRRHWYDGTTYDAADTSKIAIYTTACPNGIIKPARLLGKCTAVVNVSDTGHRFAEASNGSTVLASAASGDIAILSGNKISGTGEQELTVLLGGGGGGGDVNLRFGIVTTEIGPATGDLTGIVPGEGEYKICDTDVDGVRVPTGDPIAAMNYDPGTTYAEGIGIYVLRGTIHEVVSAACVPFT